MPDENANRECNRFEVSRSAPDAVEIRNTLAGHVRTFHGQMSALTAYLRCNACPDARVGDGQQVGGVPETKPKVFCTRNDGVCGLNESSNW